MEPDFENLTPEEVDAILRSAGYDPRLMGKYFQAVADRAILEQKLVVARKALFNVYVGATPDAYWWKDVVAALTVIGSTQ